MNDYDITTAMISFGGSFVALLGRLWIQGDNENRAKLKAAFPEYWAEYAELAALKAAK